MTEGTRGPQGTESQRRWRIPPPLLRDVGDPGPEGLQIVQEIPTGLGVLLWKSLRGVTLWARTPPAERGGLFDPGAADRRRAEILLAVPEGEEELAGLLEELVQVFQDPARTDPESVGLACLRVASWAESKGGRRTALEFLQGGALACPGDPAFALAIVRTARDLAQYSRAEAWFFRAVGLARQCRDWDTYVRAYLAHAKMMLRRGSFPAARRSVLKALRRSTRQGLAEARAMALHDLFVIEDNMGRPEAAQARALEALQAYGPDHPQLPLLVHDLACFWLQQGRFLDAFQVVREVLPRIPARHRVVALGTLARAAGGAAEAEAFAASAQELSLHGEGPGVAEAWLEAARGALLLGRYEEARESVHRAEQIARDRGETKVRFLAEAVLDSVAAEERALEARPRTVQQKTPAPEAGLVVRLMRERVVGAPAV